ncbi:MAG: nuclear transport factor 2 family protein [Novosphingobium sp.]|nr:nuclear transport factor 2 family protein [Novosphingobium sp.]MCP5404339.1 nuclear transport factor 2 family protein [Novosphingobium sp.]
MATTTEDLPVELREWLDRSQITEALYTYCRAVDRVDRELGYSIWNEGAQVDYGEAIFVGPARGVIDHICDSHLQGIAHSHQIANVIIRLDGDRAFSEAYVNSAMRMMHEGELLQVNTRGRYLDRWSRRDGRWGIDRRVFVNDFDEVRRAVPGSIPPRLTLDRNDLSYALFEGRL